MNQQIALDTQRFIHSLNNLSQKHQGRELERGQQHILFLLTNDFSHLTFSCAIEPLQLANDVSNKNLFSWSFCSDDGISATSYSQITILVDHHYKSLPKADFIFVLSGKICANTFSPELLAMLRKYRAHGQRIGALGTGVFALAKAGLLAGQKVALHWEMHDSFRELFPDVILCDDVFVLDEAYATAAGGTAAGDFVLQLIQRTHGEDLSFAVADRMIMAAPREASASQCVSFQSKNGIRNPNLALALDYMSKTLEEPMSPTDIAQKVGISTRQLERIFHSHIGTSPKRHYIGMRLQRARRLLMQTEKSITEVAMACGFNSNSHFSRLYKSKFEHSPTAQRGWLS